MDEKKPSHIIQMYHIYVSRIETLIQTYIFYIFAHMDIIFFMLLTLIHTYIQCDLGEI